MLRYFIVSLLTYVTPVLCSGNAAPELTNVVASFRAQRNTIPLDQLILPVQQFADSQLSPTHALNLLRNSVSGLLNANKPVTDAESVKVLGSISNILHGETYNLDPLNAALLEQSITRLLTAIPHMTQATFAMLLNNICDILAIILRLPVGNIVTTTAAPPISSTDIATIPTIGSVSTVPVKPEARPNSDAFVRGGIYADINYGGPASGLEVKFATDQDYLRESFIRFDITEAPLNLDQVTLKMYVNQLDSGSAASIWNVNSLVDNTWDAATITYNTRPVPSVPLATALPVAVGSYVTWDVTSAVKAAQMVSNNVNFHLDMSLEVFENGVVFASFADPDVSKRPVLVYS